MTRSTLARPLVALLIAILTLGALPAAPTLAAPPPSDLDLAFRWAPIHRQDTDDTDADADFLTAVDFDGDWDTLNNWEHQDDNPATLTAAVYFSVVESPTHWFIIYAFYHPRDWCDTTGCQAFDEHHENDMEGVLAIVRKDGTTFGQFQGLVTVAHNDFYSFTPNGSPLTSGQESIDGRVRMQAGPDGRLRPVTFQEARGHGVTAWDGGGFPGGDGVVYLPSLTLAEAPASGNDRSVRYRLVDILEPGGLWARRNNSETFASPGVFRGDNGADNAAKAPWRWDDEDDGGQLRGGELAVDPAKLVDIYFDGLGTFSGAYWRNAYTFIPAPIYLHLGTVTPTSIQITWQDPNIFGNAHEVWRSANGGASWAVVASVPIGEEDAWTDTGVSAGASYLYKVRPCLPDRCLDFSNTVRGGIGLETLTVAVTGKGRVTSTPAGIDCGVSAGGAGGDCSASFPAGTVVTLTPAPYIVQPEEWYLADWAGACDAATGACSVTMHTDLTATAVFAQLILQ